MAKNKRVLKLAKECLSTTLNGDKRIPKDVVCSAFRYICFLKHPQPECNKDCKYFSHRKGTRIG